MKKRIIILIGMISVFSSSFIFTFLTCALSYASNHSESRIDCFNNTANYDLTNKQRILLCTGARSDSPLQCFNTATIKTDLTKDQRIRLCQGASSDAPFRCFTNSYNKGLTYDQQIKLCSGASTTNPNQCIDTLLTQGVPLYGDQQVTLCAEAISDEPLQCFQNSFGLPLTLDERSKLCTDASVNY